MKFFRIIGVGFIFIAVLILQQVESRKKAYELRVLKLELEQLENINSALDFRVKELRSSEYLMNFAEQNNFEFPKGSRIIYVNICTKKDR